MARTTLDFHVVHGTLGTVARAIDLRSAMAIVGAGIAGCTVRWLGFELWGWRSDGRSSKRPSPPDALDLAQRRLERVQLAYRGSSLEARLGDAGRAWKRALRAELRAMGPSRPRA